MKTPETDMEKLVKTLKIFEKQSQRKEKHWIKVGNLGLGLQQRGFTNAVSHILALCKTEFKVK